MRDHDNEIEHFFTKVVGVTYKNPDNTSRQKAIRESAAGEHILFETGKSKKYPNAIAVLNRQGRQVGNLSEGVAEEIYKEMKAGLRHAGRIVEISGGSEGKEFYGMNLIIIKIPPNFTDAQALAYLNENAPARSRSESTLRSHRPVAARQKAGCVGVILFFFAAFSILIRHLRH